MASIHSRRDFLRQAAAWAGAPFLLGGCASLRPRADLPRKPNIVLILLDDSGWADYAPFGHPRYATPHITALAEEGRVFRDFYVPQAVCSASRAALLSGCYPVRTKVFNALPPRKPGLSRDFKIMSEVFGANGYHTAIFGKWHIGDVDGQRPWDRGFDQSCGLLYSNDMWQNNPVHPKYWARFPLQYFENGKVTIDRMTATDQPMLTTWYTEKAVDFIRANREHPFFLYVPHSMPHVPLYVSEKFRGQSGAGLYGDVMMELDWSIGQITGTLRDEGLEEDTIVILTSDNGPWLIYGNHAGKTPFREGKHTSFDGGLKSACVMKYPRRIPAGTVCDQMLCTVDLLPTLAKVTGSVLPGYEIDGRDVWGLITGQAGAVNPHAYYPISYGKQFQGVISADGRWKLHLPHWYNHLKTAGRDGMPCTYEKLDLPLSLYDLKNDPYETTDVKDAHPEVLKRLLGYAQRHRRQFYPYQKSDL